MHHKPASCTRPTAASPFGPTDGGVSCDGKTISTTSRAFEVSRKRRRGYPSETRVGRGDRVVHGDKELLREAPAATPLPLRLRTQISRPAACAPARFDGSERKHYVRE